MKEQSNLRERKSQFLGHLDKCQAIEDSPIVSSLAAHPARWRQDIDALVVANGRGPHASLPRYLADGEFLHAMAGSVPKIALSLLSIRLDFKLT